MQVAFRLAPKSLLFNLLVEEGPGIKNKDVYIYPEVCVAIDHHGSLNELIGTFQKVMSRDHTSIIDQD